MHQKPTQQTIQLSAIVSGRLIDGKVTFSPAPQPGILAELAKFEARRIFAAMVEEEIAAGRLSLLGATEVILGAGDPLIPERPLITE